MNRLRRHVLIKNNKNIPLLKKTSEEWIKASVANKISYEIDWLGIPIIQTPEDMILMQELIWFVRPNYVIDVGMGHGGSAIYYASLLDHIEPDSKVIMVEKEIKEHNLSELIKHNLWNKILLVQGDSTSTATIEQIKKTIDSVSKCIICLDSNHTKSHVLNELNLYSQFVNVGSYIVVFDTITSDMAKHRICDKKYIDNGPMEAIEKFLDNNSNFEIDERYNKLYTGYCKNGFLRRVA